MNALLKLAMFRIKMLGVIFFLLYITVYRSLRHDTIWQYLCGEGLCE